MVLSAKKPVDADYSALTKKMEMNAIVPKFKVGDRVSVLPKITLVTFYKAFVRPHLDYEDILYEQAFNNSFHDRLESIQYNACLAITGAIRGTSREKLYQELALDSLRLSRWCRRPFFL